MKAFCFPMSGFNYGDLMKGLYKRKAAQTDAGIDEPIFCTRKVKN